MTTNQTCPNCGWDLAQVPSEPSSATAKAMQLGFTAALHGWSRTGRQQTTKKLEIYWDRGYDIGIKVKDER